jgi:hypothetical protein
MAKTEGQIAADLLAGPDVNHRGAAYDAAALRHEMGDAFVTDIHEPPVHVRHVSDIEYVEL